MTLKHRLHLLRFSLSAYGFENSAYDYGASVGSYHQRVGFYLGSGVIDGGSEDALEVSTLKLETQKQHYKYVSMHHDAEQVVWSVHQLGNE